MPGKNTARRPGLRPRFTNSVTAEPVSSSRRECRSQLCASNWGIATFRVRCSMQRAIKPRSNRTYSNINGAKEGSGKRMSKDCTTPAWEAENEEVRRLFTLTPDDLYFLRPTRADAQRLYRACFTG